MQPCTAACMTGKPSTTPCGGAASSQISQVRSGTSWDIAASRQLGARSCCCQATCFQANTTRGMLVVLLVQDRPVVLLSALRPEGVGQLLHSSTGAVRAALCVLCCWPHHPTNPRQGPRQASPDCLGPRRCAAAPQSGPPPPSHPLSAPAAGWGQPPSVQGRTCSSAAGKAWGWG